jgi:hypothetical protein
LTEKWKNLIEKGRLTLKQFIGGNLLIEKKRFLEDLVEDFRRNAAVGEEIEDHDEAGQQAYEKKREFLDLAEKEKEKGRLTLKRFIVGSLLIEKKRSWKI